MKKYLITVLPMLLSFAALAGQEGYGGGTYATRLQCDPFTNAQGEILLGSGAPYIYWVGPAYVLVLPKMTYPKTEERIGMKRVGQNVPIPGGYQQTMKSDDGRFVLAIFVDSKTKKWESGILTVGSGDIKATCSSPQDN